MLLLCFILEDTKRVKWHRGYVGDTVRLDRPTVEDIQDVVIPILKREKDINNVTHKEIYLEYSSTQSILLLLTLFNETAVSCLEICYTILTKQCIQHLNDTNITVLVLINCTIVDINSICQLITTNTTLPDLRLYTDELTDNQLTQILDSLTINETMRLTLPPRYRTKCTPHENYQKLKHKLHYW